MRIKLKKEYADFLKQNAKELLKYLDDNDSVEYAKANDFLMDLDDWMLDNGFTMDCYYNKKGVYAQKIYDFVYEA